MAIPLRAKSNKSADPMVGIANDFKYDDLWDMFRMGKGMTVLKL
jgi:hypothetical protein